MYAKNVWMQDQRDARACSKANAGGKAVARSARSPAWHWPRGPTPNEKDDDPIVVVAQSARTSSGAARSITNVDLQLAARGRLIAELGTGFKLFDPAGADPHFAAKRLLDGAPPDLWPSHHVHFSSAKVARCAETLAAIAKQLKARQL